MTGYRNKGGWLRKDVRVHKYGRAPAFLFRLWVESLLGFLPGAASLSGFAQSTNNVRQDQAATLIRNSHQDRVYLLSHEFVYTVTADIYGKSITLPLVKDGQSHFTAWVPDSNVNTIYATAFGVDSSGHCVTSRYAIEPWNNPYDQSVLKATFSKELGLPESAITVSGISRNLLLRRDGKRVNGMTLRGIDGTAAEGASPSSSEPACLYGYLPHGVADTLSPPLMKWLVVIKRPGGLIEVGQTGEPLPEGAPVFTAQGILLGVYSGVPRK